MASTGIPMETGQLNRCTSISSREVNDTLEFIAAASPGSLEVSLPELPWGRWPAGQAWSHLEPPREPWFSLASVSGWRSLELLPLVPNPVAFSLQ